MKETDVLIVGAGLSGAVTALRLARAGIGADVIAPRWRDLPSARDIGLADAPLESALKARPVLAAFLSDIASRADGRPAKAIVEQLGSQDPASLQQLLMIIAGAYYMHPAVRDALRYSGQQAQSLARDGFGAEELAIEMMQQPPRYRRAK